MRAVVPRMVGEHDPKRSGRVNHMKEAEGMITIILGKLMSGHDRFSSVKRKQLQLLVYTL